MKESEDDSNSGRGYDRFAFYKEFGSITKIPESIDITMSIPTNKLWYAYLDNKLTAAKNDGNLDWKIDLAGKLWMIKLDNRSKFGSKDWSMYSALQSLSDCGCLDEEGDVTPIMKPIYINGMRVVPNKYTSYVGTSKYVRKKMGYMHLHASKQVPWTPIGKNISDIEWRRLCEKAVKVVGEKGPDHKWFEGQELYPDGLSRGLFFPIMLYAREALYRPIGRQTVLPNFSGKFYIPDFQSLSSFEDVRVENPSGGMGFPLLAPLSKIGESYLNSVGYKLSVQRANVLRDLLKVAPLTRRALVGLGYPHQVGVRFQGYGRGITIYDKAKMLLGSLIGQPLTLALEEEPWYASGDLIDRIESARLIRSGRNRHLDDGDDGVYVPEGGDLHGIPIAIDFSAFESSITWDDHKWFLDQVNHSMRTGCSTKTPLNISTEEFRNIVYNLFVDSASSGRVTAMGTFQKDVMGVDSGSPFTHNEETVVHKAKDDYVDSVRPVDLDALVAAYQQTGSEIRKSAQYVPKDLNVIIAKRISDGTERGTYGSTVRSITSIFQTEGPWDIPKGQTQDEWEASRILSIGLNIYQSPGYVVWLEALKQAKFTMKDLNMKTVYKGALRYAEKRRGLPIKVKRQTGLAQNSLEKSIMTKVYKDLTTLD